MAKTTYNGYLRQRGANSRRATPAVFPAVIKISFNPTAASAATGKYLPAGAIPIGVQSLGGATGGSNPTVDIGTAAAAAGLANELDADNLGAMTATGAQLGTALTVDTEIYAGVGASAAAGGTHTALVYYVMSDAG